MVTLSREIKRIVRVQETCLFYRRFPRRLKTYLLAKYEYGEWPYGYPEDDGSLFSRIYADALSYFNDDFDATIEPPMVRAIKEIESTRELCCKAMQEKMELEAYIDELHELLWANGLEGRQMLHDETGEHKGTYAEFNTLHPEEFE
ncbi:MAG: hypothetical protein LUC94_06890 [Clostridiales bacterium]|nr:hypothetical protein [Clostridiales bacterium]